MPGESNDVLDRILREVVDGRRALERRIDALDEKVDAFRNETLSALDAFAIRLERVESEVQAIRAALKRLEARADRDDADRVELRRAVEKLKAEIAELEERIAQLESDRHDA